MTTKQTVKSCSCFACKRGKSSKGATIQMRSDERAARRATKQALRAGTHDNILATHRTGRTD